MGKSLTDQHPKSLAHDPRFCIKYEDGCATWISDNNFIKPTKEIFSLAEKVLFAVKTCKKYHKERLPVIFQTWGKAALNVEYFSDVAEARYRTKVLPEVYRNTEIGHCLKTEAILKYFNKNMVVKGWKWLIIVDDDTIIGIHKMLGFLHDYSANEPLIIGQRYGYLLSEEKRGYDYLAGGAGIVYSSAMVAEIMKDNGRYCSCPKPDEHDDMYLAGVCIKNARMPVLHSDRFHQNSPSDYSPELLRNRDPISFHKFYNIDEEYGTLNWNNPKKTYNKYFNHSDAYLRMYKYNNQKHCYEH